MKLESMSIRNFRCYKEKTTIQFKDFTTIIGKNDIGKSTILEALEIFFNNNIVKIDSGDCSVTADDQSVEITCEFSDLPERIILDSQAETNLSDEYLLNSNNNLQIKKIYKCSSAKPKEEIYITCTHPRKNKFNDLLELNIKVLKDRLKELGVIDGSVQLNNNPSIRKAIWNSCTDLEINEVDIQVNKEDAKKIYDKLSNYLPIYALFQSDRSSKDSDAEVQDPMKLAINTALSEISIQEKLNEIINAVREKATEIANKTHEELKKIDPELAEKLEPEFKAEPKWGGLFNLSLNSDEGIPVNKRGSGVRRLILVSFFRAAAERKLEEAETTNIIYAIEEPETSQHPNNQKILINSLLELSSEPGCQVLITTHSPGLASFLPIESFRFIHKTEDCKVKIENANEDTWTKIALSLGVIPDNRIKVLICMEGKTDIIALKCLSKALHANDHTLVDLSSDSRIAFIPLGGSSLKEWVNQYYLKELGRPEIHIYDRDVAEYQEVITHVNSRNDGSWGVLTQKLEIENYLHPDAISEALKVNINVGDTDDIPAIISKMTSVNQNKIKRKLANYAFPKMNATQIAQRDPNGEVEGWMRRIGVSLS